MVAWSGRAQGRIPVVGRELVAVRRKPGEGRRCDHRVGRVSADVVVAEQERSFHDVRRRRVSGLRRRRTRPEAASAAATRWHVWKIKFSLLKVAQATNPQSQSCLFSMPMLLNAQWFLTYFLHIKQIKTVSDFSMYLKLRPDVIVTRPLEYQYS